MKIFAFALVMVTLAFSTSVRAQEKKLKLEDLKWLTGCWKASKEARNDTFEQWTKPVGGAMLGIGTTLGKDGKITSYEYMRIEAQGNGELVFTAKPAKQTEASFTLTSSVESNLVFENPTHDFPQRVIYRREKDGSLEARIDGMKDGEKRAALFPMVKTSCE